MQNRCAFAVKDSFYGQQVFNIVCVCVCVCVCDRERERDRDECTVTAQCN